MVKELDDRLGRTGRKARAFSGKNASEGDVGHTVYIFLGRQTVADLFFMSPELAWKRPQHDTAMDVSVGIDLFNGFYKLILAGVFRKAVFKYVYPEPRGSQSGIVFIGEHRP